MSFRIVSVDGRYWQSFRDQRLEMLADSPKAFVETLDSATAQTDSQWQQRAEGTNSTVSCGFAAVDDTDAWLGIMRARIEDGRAFLLGVYVSPAARGGGVADALLREIEQWVYRQGHRTLTLEVHEANGRAQAFYRRMGFATTGETVPYPLAPDELEIVMAKQVVCAG